MQRLLDQSAVACRARGAASSGCSPASGGARWLPSPQGARALAGCSSFCGYVTLAPRRRARETHAVLLALLLDGDEGGARK